MPPSASAVRLGVEQENQDVVVLDQVFLAFGAHLAGILGACLAFVGDEVVESYGLGADEAVRALMPRFDKLGDIDGELH